MHPQPLPLEVETQPDMAGKVRILWQEVRMQVLGTAELRGKPQLPHLKKMGTIRIPH